MKLDPHEEYIRNMLSGQKIPVDADQLWKRLEQFVPESKPRKPKVIYFLWPLLLLSVFSGLFVPTSEISNYNSNGEMIELQILRKAMAGIDIRSIDWLVGKNNYSFGSDIEKERSLLQDLQTSAGKTIVKPGFSKSNKDGETNFLHKKVLKISNQSTLVNFGKGPDERGMSAENSSISSIESKRIVPDNLEGLETLSFDFLKSKQRKMFRMKRIKPVKQVPIILNFGIHGGYGIQDHKKATTQENDFLAKYRETDTGKELTGAQIGVSIPVYDRLYAKTGLNYSRIRTQLTLDEIRYSRIEMNGTVGTWEDENGNLQQVDGVVSATRVTRYRSSWSSAHHVLNIPLSLGYQIIRYKRHIFSAELGVVYQMVHQFKGVSWNPDFTLEHHKVFDKAFNHNAFSLGFGLEYEYRLSTRYSLYGGIQYSDLRLESNNSEWDLDKKIYLPNCVFGAKMHLRGK